MGGVFGALPLGASISTDAGHPVSLVRPSEIHLGSVFSQDLSLPSLKALVSASEETEPSQMDGVHTSAMQARQATYYATVWATDERNPSWMGGETARMVDRAFAEWDDLRLVVGWPAVAERQDR
jgi:hypothetical protein